MLNTQNTNYDPNKREQGNDSVYTKQKSSESFGEQIVSAHLAASAFAQTNVRPPIARIGMVAPRFGYDNTPLTIHDVFNADQLFTTPSMDWSGGEGQGYQGTSFPNITNQL